MLVIRAKIVRFCKDVQLHSRKIEYNIHVVVCGKKGGVFNDTFGMLWSDDEKPNTTFLQNLTISVSIIDIQDIGVTIKKQSHLRPSL